MLLEKSISTIKSKTVTIDVWKDGFITISDKIGEIIIEISDLDNFIDAIKELEEKIKDLM